LRVSLGEDVGARVFNRFGKVGYDALTENELLAEAKKMVVKRRNMLVNRMKLSGMTQGGDKPITSFETRLKPVARTGKFKEECQGCNQQVDFTDQMVLDNIIRGLSDEDIKRKVLAMPEPDCTLEKVIKFIEAEESGKYSLSDTKDLASVAGFSTYKKQQRGNERETPPASPYADKNCRNCGNMGHISTFTKCPAKKEKCEGCGKIGHIKKCCKRNASTLHKTK
jgi:hypothetical protein